MGAIDAVRHAQTVVWLLASARSTCPGAAVYHLNREILSKAASTCGPAARFGDTAGFSSAWNIWAYALTTIATILFQIPASSLTWSARRRLDSETLVVFCFLAGVLTIAGALRCSGPRHRQWIHNISGLAMIAAFALLISHRSGCPASRATTSHPSTCSFIRCAPRSPHRSDLFAAAASNTLPSWPASQRHPARDIGRSILHRLAHYLF